MQQILDITEQYLISKTDGSEIKEGKEYYVLDFDCDKNRQIILAYAREVGGQLLQNIQAFIAKRKSYSLSLEAFERSQTSEQGKSSSWSLPTTPPNPKSLYQKYQVRSSLGQELTNKDFFVLALDDPIARQILFLNPIAP